MLCQRGSLSVSRRSYCSRYRTLRVGLFNNWGQLNFLFLTNLHSVPKEDFNKIGPQKTRKMNFQTIHAFFKKLESDRCLHSHGCASFADEKVRHGAAGHRSVFFTSFDADERHGVRNAQRFGTIAFRRAKSHGWWIVIRGGSVSLTIPIPEQDRRQFHRNQLIQQSSFVKIKQNNNRSFSPLLFFLSRIDPEIKNQWDPEKPSWNRPLHRYANLKGTSIFYFLYSLLPPKRWIDPSWLLLTDNWQRERQGSSRQFD